MKSLLLLCMPASEQSELLKSIGLCQGYEVRQIETEWLAVVNGLASEGFSQRECLVIVELSELNRVQFDLKGFVRKTVANERGNLKLLISANNLACVTPAQQCLALAWGAAGLIPSMAKRRIKHQLRDSTGLLLQRFFGSIKIERLQSFISTLPEGLGRSVGLQDQHLALATLEATDITLDHIEQWARSSAGFSVADRTWHLRSYAQTFIGSEAVQALCKRFNLNSKLALIVGQLLQSNCVLDHVTFEHQFEAADLFYRFSDAQIVTTVSLAKVYRVLKADVRALDRRYLGKVYRQSFLGAEGADVVAKHFGINHDTAVRLIQQLMNLGLLQHVTREHQFRPTENFYEFCGLGAQRKEPLSTRGFEVQVPVFAAAIS
jgi:hypothetical protein